MMSITKTSRMKIAQNAVVITTVLISSIKAVQNAVGMKREQKWGVARAVRRRL